MKDVKDTQGRIIMSGNNQSVKILTDSSVTLCALFIKFLNFSCVLGKFGDWNKNGKQQY